MKTVKTLLLVLFLFSPVFAQELPPVAAPIKAVIKGPKEALAGTLIVVSNEDAIGDNKVWILPEGIKDQVAVCTNSIFAVLPTPGEYKFGLIVADKQANIAYTFITIVAKKQISVPEVTPDPITPPTSPKTFTALRTVSVTGSSFLADNETSKRLNVELTRLATSIKGKALPEAKAEVQKGLEQVFATRSYESRKKDWISNWRLQVNAELDKLQITDTNTYSQAMLAIAGALCMDGKCPIP